MQALARSGGVTQARQRRNSKAFERLMKRVYYVTMHKWNKYGEMLSVGRN